jgi:large subunit ribosomal protein L10e
MAGLRAGRCYTKVKRAYTRKSKFKKKAFIRSVPTVKIVKYDQGDLKKDFPVNVNMVSKERIQIRHNSLEAARQVLNRHVSKRLGTNYHLKVRVFPHHVLRENKMLTGAGADRMQTGMQRAFGRAIGTAAQMKIGQAIFTVQVDKKDIPAAKDALKAAMYKLPGKCGVEIVNKAK